MNFAINSTKNFILFNYYIIKIIFYEKQINLNFLSSFFYGNLVLKIRLLIDCQLIFFM